jgi:glucosamine--fructose-6-phosphate aminotransferase (isomerizing)
MPPDTYEQLLQIPQPQLVDIALDGLGRRPETLAAVIEHVQQQLDDLDQVITAAGVERIYLVGCGDSYFAALAARYAAEQLTGLPTVAVPSMEFARYTLVPPNSLVAAISSRGQVAMTLEAGRVARQAGARVIGVTAHTGSPMAQEFSSLITAPGASSGDTADQVALILGNFSFSLAALYLAAVHLGHRRGHLDVETARQTEAQIRAIPSTVQEALGCSASVHQYLEQVSDQADFYFLGAGPSYGIALFCQAKFFEQARRPVYGVQMEEFSHQQFFLLQRGVDAQVWFVAPQGRSRDRVQSIVTGCRDMGAHTIAIATSDDDQIRDQVDLTFPVPTTSEMFSPLVSAVPGELLGIYAFGRWGIERSFASKRRRQIAISTQLTREGQSKP